MIKIAFYNEKSSVGKSLLSIQIANAFSENYGKNIAIIDTVTGERSLYKKRIFEKENSFSSYDNNLNEILHCSNYKEFDEIIHNLTQDIAIIDVQGISEEKLNFLFNCDFIFLVSDYESESDFKLDKRLFKSFESLIVEKDIKIKNVYMLFNRINDKDDTSKIKTIEELNIRKVKTILSEKQMLRNINTLQVINDTDLTVITSEIFKIIFEEEEVEIL